MNCRSGIFLAGVLATLTAIASPLAAAEHPPGPAMAAPNAAVIYWQAFSLLPPPVAEPQKTKYEAAASAPTAPVPGELRPMLEDFTDSLGQLHRGSRVAACDWNLDYDAGPGCLLPHLANARTLSTAALLRARLRFAAGKSDEGVADVMAVLKLARDCGSSPLLLSLLVDAAIEQTATEVLAANLARLSPPQLDRLAAAVESLPATPSVSDCMRHEIRTFGDWMARCIDVEAAKSDDPKAGGKILAGLFRQVNAGLNDDGSEAKLRRLFDTLSVDDVRKSLQLARGLGEQAATTAELPAAERRGRQVTFEAAEPKAEAADTCTQAAGVLASMFMPAVEKAWQRADAANVRRQLLLRAIQAQRHGADAIRGCVVGGHGQIECRATDAGFELSCPTGSTDAPVVLAVIRPR